MQFSRKVGNWSVNKRLNFGGDPDDGSGKTCLGGGMHCSSASSLLSFCFFLDPRCRLSSLSVSFSAHAKHSISYHIMRNDIVLLLACQKRTDVVRVYTVWHSAFTGAAEVD